MKLDSRYADYFPEYSDYFETALILLKFIYGMTNSRNLFYDELTYWLINVSVFKHFQLRMSIYYNYALDGEYLLFYLMLMILFIGIHMRLLDVNFLGVHIGLCQSLFHSSRTIPFQYIRIYILLLLWINI